MSMHHPLRTAALAGATLAAALAAAGPASAAPAVAGEFPAAGLTDTPNRLTLGPDGNVWVALAGATNDLAKITPAGDVTYFNPTDVTGPYGITTGPDGNLWVTQINGVARFSPANPDAAVKTTINDIGGPQDIVSGPDGNLWTASGANVIKIPPTNPAGFTTNGATGVQNARGIDVGGDGAIYVADFAPQLVRITTSFGANVIPTGNGLQDVVRGPGNEMAYTVQGSNPHQLGRVTFPAAPVTTDLPATDPFGVTYADDGAYWVARALGNDVARIGADGAVSTTLSFSAAARPEWITKGQNGTLWVVLKDAKKVARITGVEAPAATPTPTTPTQTPTTTPPTAELALAITKFKAFPSSFKKGTRLPALTQSKLGSQLRFSITKPATVRFRFAKGTVGRKVGSSCVKRTRQNASKKRCVYYTAVPGSFSVKPAAAGDHRVRFQGRITSKLSLTPGRYQATATATGTDGKAATPVKATFAIKTS